MAPRINVPGRLVNASAGRVHITRYFDTITLEVAKRSQEDYVEHCAKFGGQAVPVVMITDRPIPMPDVEVRGYWRTIAVEPGFEAVALIMTGTLGLMAAAVTHLGEQLIQVLGVSFRSFKKSDDAAYWLTETVNCEIDEFDLMDVVDEILALTAETAE